MSGSFLGWEGRIKFTTLPQLRWVSWGGGSLTCLGGTTPEGGTWDCKPFTNQGFPKPRGTCTAVHTHSGEVPGPGSPTTANTEAEEHVSEAGHTKYTAKPGLKSEPALQHVRIDRN